jgi:hypothetical protein
MFLSPTAFIEPFGTALSGELASIKELTQLRQIYDNAHSV